MSDKQIWDRATFSGLQRITMIVECVRTSGEHLSAGDRMELINDLIDSNEKVTPEIIEAHAKEMADARLERNIAVAGWVRRMRD